MKKKRRYFIYKTTTPYANGTICTQSIVSCYGFVNLHDLQEETLKRIREDNPHLKISQRPIVDFLMEITKKEFEIWNYKPNSEQN